MKETFKELLAEATTHANDVYNKMEVEPDGDFDIWFNNLVFEKFAELIVNESADFLNKWRAPEHSIKNGFDKGADWAFLKSGELLKLHFGITKFDFEKEDK